jgi:hypothetical protein
VATAFQRIQPINDQLSLGTPEVSRTMGVGAHYTNHTASSSSPAGSAARSGAGARDCAATAGAYPNGAKAESGSSASGLGGLGLDWMVGAASDGAAAEPSSAGDGSNGIMSGDGAGAGASAEWEGWRGGGYSGAAEMAAAAWWSAARTARPRRRRARVLAIASSSLAWRLRAGLVARGPRPGDVCTAPHGLACRLFATCAVKWRGCGEMVVAEWRSGRVGFGVWSERGSRWARTAHVTWRHATVAGAGHCARTGGG